jgi:DNA helicase II / ATP-dependent DNA helicase PcrA
MTNLKDKLLQLLQNEADAQNQSLEALISGLTLPGHQGLSPNTGFYQKSDGLEFDDYEEIFMDEETEQTIRELKRITDDIEHKLLPAVEFKPAKSIRIDYKNELNPQQLAAVLTVNAPLLVIAGAGSGKTRVITYKVSWLIENGIHPSQILLLTFTRKAAAEMLTRVEKLLGDRSVSNVLGGTFHGFSNYILRQYANLIGLPANFSIIDTEDSADIIDLLKNELKLSVRKKGRPFPRKDKIQDIISKSKNLELSVTDTIVRYYDENSEFIQEITLLARALTAYKKASNLLDYDDLMEVLRDKLRDHEVFRNKLRERIKYVLVDEYQDINNIQREIVELLCLGKNNLTVVGDDAQSIYAFRGANFEHILRFPQSFSNCRVVKIEENYRSEQGILDFTNEIIRNARIGFRKNLFSTRTTGKKPMVRRFADGPEEAEFIVDKVIELRNNNLGYENFAVLTRASWHSNYVQTELMKRQIPFVVVGGIKFSERRHVKDIIAFLKLTLNPLDAVAWNRILQMVEGIGKVRASEIIAVIHANAGRIDFSAFRGKSYYMELQKLEELFGKLIGGAMTPVQILDILFPWYTPVLKKLEDDYEVRLKDLEVFRVIAGRYSELEKFLSDFTLEPPSNRYQDESSPLLHTDEKPLVVSTIHSSKGLEWHTVFIPFALDGLMPSVRAMESLKEMEEERRLFYVASSRAKENLFITMPAYVSSWDAVFNRPSRFLAEIDKGKYLVR